MSQPKNDCQILEHDKGEGKRLLKLANVNMSIDKVLAFAQDYSDNTADFATK